MLKIKVQGQNQGGETSGKGWRYSPTDGQEQILAVIAEKLPNWIVEEKPSGTWWKVFSKEQEQEFRKVLQENNLDLNDEEYLEQVDLAAELLEELDNEE